ncbi:putative HC-toxin efflux carrier TOXA [Aspergillus udagawae]|uniref:HC-toxin efflux carrier TOXA n=1 Tax=Aspergillus udagawae TaxID=91492 RepID=A0ABQ1BG49_9EURO|nr:putative HC-toxin efflux carrier TOXA [Aspergillus udagawae]GFF99590.1 putative HC-toxin efflux carrier TOXA [Aspergillus udagawae]GFG21130.1 putative HC-toxin efflux carrier TOXA [Aspergillus udagawae]GFG27996.1 putative HC-toxin efflux carrier TOXA [Aspergillus udagawae]
MMSSTPPDAMSSAQPVGSVKLYSILAGIMIATFLISLDVSIIATAIPSISTHFHATTDIGWYGATYPLTMCALQPISGKLSSLLSLRWTYLGFYGIFLLGSLICGVANSSKMFIIGRAVAGAGGSGVVSGGLSVIALITPSQQRPLFTGLVTSLYALGTVVAPVIGGALAEFTWRWCFLINLPAGAVTVVTLLLFFHPPRNPAAHDVSFLKQLDLIGCALFIPSIIMVMLALQWGGGEYPWDSATVIGLFVGFAVTMAIFIFWEGYMGDQAMIPIVLLRGRSTMLSIAFAFLFLGSFVIPVYYLPEWFQIVKSASPIRSGVMLLPSVCTQVFGSLVSGILAKHLRYYNPWLFIGSAFLCIANGLYTTFTVSSTSASWIGYQILQGLGCGFAAQIPLLTVQLVLKDRPRYVPVGIATVLFTQYFGSAVMQSIGGAIFQNELRRQLQDQASLNYEQIEMLLNAGTSRVREVTVQAFPDRLADIIIAYNNAITSIFWLSIAGSGLALILSAGIPWVNTRPTQEDDDMHCTEQTNKLQSDKQTTV